jgi:alkylation response protein AidB-like acyl-CoA dehydrogenase
MTVRSFGSAALQAEILPGVASGVIRICLGYTEPDCGSDLAGVRTRAVRDGEEWVISGQKMFTTGAQFCRYAFCLTRTDPDVPKHKGLTVFLVPLDRPGIEITPIRTIGGERTNFVHFDDVRIPDHYRIGPVNEGWMVLAAPLAQEHGRAEGEEPSGPNYSPTARRTLDALIRWLRTKAPTAVPSLEDPVVRERLARVELDIAVCNVTPGTMGRVLSADLLVRDLSDLLELLGPLGVLEAGADGAAADGVAEAAFRYAPGTTIYGGTTDVHRNLIAEHMLGLPRSTPASRPPSEQKASDRLTTR